MKHRWVAIISICLTGCLANNGLQYASVSENNIYHMAKVRLGMSEKEVLCIMHKPYSYESFEVGDDIYDVWFYVTKATGLDQSRMVAQNLTPLTFKNGVLVGTGYQWYYYAMKEEANEVAKTNPPPPKPKSQDAEDKEFEKTLEGFSRPKQSEAKPTPEKKSENKSGIMTHHSSAQNGMTEEQVVSMAGKPQTKESFDIEGDRYDVWFYETIPSKSGNISKIPQAATPLIFKNSMLISKSSDLYFELKDQLVAKARMRPKIGMSTEEIKDLIGPPSRTESYEVGSNMYDIWFYKNKMPLTFKNEILVGMTMNDYSQVKQEAGEEHVNGYTRSAEEMREAESDQNFNYW